MKARYDHETDTLTLILRNAPVTESDEDKPGVILDYDRDGALVSLEVLDASKRVEDPRAVTLLADASTARRPPRSVAARAGGLQPRSGHNPRVRHVGRRTTGKATQRDRAINQGAQANPPSAAEHPARLKADEVAPLAAPPRAYRVLDRAHDLKEYLPTTLAHAPRLTHPICSMRAWSPPRRPAWRRYLNLLRTDSPRCSPSAVKTSL